MELQSKPIEQIDKAEPGQQLRETDAVVVVLTDASGEFTGKAVLTTIATLRTSLLPTGAPVAVPPAVAFQSPANGSTLTIGTPTFLQATATDALGIKQVEFFAAGRSLGLGVATGSTYTLPYTPVAGSATVNFSAKATNTVGTEANASVFAQIVAAPTTSAKPVVTLQALGSGYVVGQLMALNASASVTGGTIAKVEFFDGGTFIGVATATPYSATYTLTSAGKHYFTAKATDNNGVSTVSSVQTVEVTAPTSGTNVRPIVRLISVTPNPATVNKSLIITAGASDNDGVVKQVEFFDGTTSLGVKTETPYALTTLPTVAGQHVYFVKATDDKGDSSTDSMTVVVNAPATGLSVPDKPVIGQTTVGTDADGSFLQVSWAPPVNTGGARLTGYEVYLVDDTLLGTTGPDERTYADYNARPGVARSYRVLAINSVGRGDKSEASAPVARPAGSVSSTQEYTTTAQDFADKCGAGTTGAAVKRSATKSASTQEAADAAALAQAKSDAIAAIVCPVAFTPTLTGPSDGDASGVTLTTDGSADQVQYTQLSNVADSTPKRMDFAAGGNTIAALDYPASYEGTTIYYKRASTGVVSTFTFSDGAVRAL